MPLHRLGVGGPRSTLKALLLTFVILLRVRVFRVFRVSDPPRTPPPILWLPAARQAPVSATVWCVLVHVAVMFRRGCSREKGQSARSGSNR